MFGLWGFERMVAKRIKRTVCDSAVFSRVCRDGEEKKKRCGGKAGEAEGGIEKGVCF